MVRALGLMVLALLCACGGAGEGEEEGPAQAADRRPPADPRSLVEVQAVAAGEVVDELVANGAVESEAQADLIPEVSGQVTSILAEEGDRVRKGQALAVIENASLQSSLEQALSNLNSAQAELDRAIALHKAGAVSDAELQAARTSHELAQVRLQEARTLRSRTQLVSPIDGTVSIRELRYGEVAGGRRAFQVVDMDRLIVVIKVPERDLPRLQVGQRAWLSPVYDEDTRVEAQLVRVSPTVDATTGTVRATVAIPRGELRLRPGQYVSVRLELARHTDTPTLPRRAVVYEEGEPVVYRVTVEEPPPEEEDAKEGQEGAGQEGGGFRLSFGGPPAGEEPEPEVLLPGPYRVARRVPVTLGLSDEDNVEVLGGVALGDEVIVTGQASLRDGARVRYPEDPPAAFAPTADAAPAADAAPKAAQPPEGAGTEG